jgi:hypothetical protein
VVGKWGKPGSKQIRLLSAGFLLSFCYFIYFYVVVLAELRRDGMLQACVG